VTDTKKPIPEDKRSGQAPGEEAVQVNDRYQGGGPPPDADPSVEEEQHPTGG
jgi:hypothetical protein